METFKQGRRVPRVIPQTKRTTAEPYSYSLRLKAAIAGVHPQKIVAQQKERAKRKCKRLRSHESRRINAQRRK